MRILLLGKNGQVGWELQRSLAPLGDVTALDRHSSDFCGDLSNLPGLAKTVQRLRPDVIVNAAAHTAVDKAESEPELARLINATAPGVLAQEAHKLGAWLVHTPPTTCLTAAAASLGKRQTRPRRSTCMARPSSKASS
jgi:dTDP-4-dehydrorhamnose reductase